MTQRIAKDKQLEIFQEPVHPNLLEIKSEKTLVYEKRKKMGKEEELSAKNCSFFVIFIRSGAASKLVIYTEI